MAIVEKERDGRIGEIILNRIEKRNALNLEMISDMITIFRELTSDEGVRIISFRSSGPDFSVGADINELFHMNREDAVIFRGKMRELTSLIHDSDKITSFFLSGFSLGGGFEISQWGDFRIAGMDAKIGQPEINIGVNAGAGGNSMFPWLIGYSNALYLSLTGKIIDVQRALQLGMIQEVVKNRVEYREILLDMTEKSHGLIDDIKKSMRSVGEKGLMKSFDMEEEIFIKAVPSDESKMLMEKFLRK